MEEDQRLQSRRSGTRSLHFRWGLIWGIYNASAHKWPSSMCTWTEKTLKHYNIPRIWRIEEQEEEEFQIFYMFNYKTRVAQLYWLIEHHFMQTIWSYWPNSFLLYFEEFPKFFFWEKHLFFFHENGIMIFKVSFFSDRVFDVLDPNDAFYDSCARPLIDEALNGFNVTIAAYGQSGSGKTTS